MANPNHDEKGRFASVDSSPSGVLSYKGMSESTYQRMLKDPNRPIQLKSVKEALNKIDAHRSLMHKLDNQARSEQTRADVRRWQGR